MANVGTQFAAFVESASRPAVMRVVSALEHATTCEVNACNVFMCSRMKFAMRHARNCTVTPPLCRFCKHFVAICCVHSKFCKGGCKMPRCEHIRQKIRMAELKTTLSRHIDCCGVELIEEGLVTDLPVILAEAERRVAQTVTLHLAWSPPRHCHLSLAGRTRVATVLLCGARVASWYWSSSETAAASRADVVASAAHRLPSLPIEMWYAILRQASLCQLQ